VGRCRATHCRAGARAPRAGRAARLWRRPDPVAVARLDHAGDLANRDLGRRRSARAARGARRPPARALFVRRSILHPAPVLDLRLFRTRSFAVANLATLVYAMGFFAMLLGNILFLTDVWQYSILHAGLAVTPGPLVVALVSGFAGRAAGRVGFRRVLLPGSACFASGLAWFAIRVGEQPAAQRLSKPAIPSAFTVNGRGLVALGFAELGLVARWGRRAEGLIAGAVQRSVVTGSCGRSAASAAGRRARPWSVSGRVGPRLSRTLNSRAAATIAAWGARAVTGAARAAVVRARRGAGSGRSARA
jgi:hypothetical protein